MKLNLNKTDIEAIILSWTEKEMPGKFNKEGEKENE